MKILIVDDNSFYRELIKEALLSRQPSLEISEAKNQRDVLEIIRNSLPDLIILDIRLPEGSGLELTCQIKKSYPHVQIVILTDHDPSEHLEAALRCEADHFLSKYTFLSLLSSPLQKTH